MRMRQYAWRNLFTKPLRTALALIGLSIPILGIMRLFSLSGGLRNMVSDTLSRVEGVMVIRENATHPAFSQLPARMLVALQKLPEVRLVAPEVWGSAPGITLGGLLSRGRQTLLSQPTILGMDIEAHRVLNSAVYPRAMKENGEGRFLTGDDAGKPNIVISRKIARDFMNPDGKPRKPGDTLRIGGRSFTIVGLYETGSMLLDGVIVMDINTARALLNVGPETVSAYYVEARKAAQNQKLSRAIEAAEPGVEAQNMSEFMADFGALMGYVDRFLLMAVSLALAVGVVGIVNTMLMSTSERFVEFGVLRTNGWSQRNILTLVTLESAYIGLLAGVIGCLLSAALVMGINQFVSGGMRLTMPPWLFALGIALSVVTGTLGGLYPAWRAARLVPMEAIRLGSH